MLPPPVVPSASKPYLGAIGAPPFRFQEPAPPPDLVTRPAAGAPPQPSSIKDEALADAVPPATPSATPATLATVPTAANAHPTTESSDGSSAPDATAPTRGPAPILRDELHRQTRAEDFLPFFQIPATQPGDVTILPVPRTPSAPLPASSATYTQSPK